MKKFAALLAVVLLVVSFASISAQETEVYKHHASKCTALDLETKVKFQKLKLQYELAMVDLKAEKEKIHEEMMTELLKEESSTKTIEKLGKSINGVQYKMHKAKIDFVLKVKKVLPADHWKGFLMMQHCGSLGCSHSSHSAHGSAKCPMVGTKGHTCTPACGTGHHGEGGHKTTGCKTPCVKVKM
ncbi:MAG: hypothetical protein KAU49_05275 [Candidatus Krumholzibacteria bacterium]|nr:hypothetical protein [Candidatus Krumholzibacteria bacterium]